MNKKSNPHPFRPTNSGFTLIELLIVMVTSALIFLLGFANYRGYQKRQYIETAYRLVASDLRLVQEYALGNKKPIEPVGNPCETTALRGYNFIRDPSGISYSIQAQCEGGIVDIKTSVPLPSGITMQMTGGNTLLFMILGKGVNRNAVITLQWPSSGMPDKQITVSRGGLIR